MDNDRIVHSRRWGLAVSLIVAIIFCIFVGSCRTRQGVVSESRHYDSAWSVRDVQNGHGDSVVYKERVEIVPRLVHVGDTAIVTMDTIINRYTERTVNNNNYFYYDNGKQTRDSANMKNTAVKPQQPAKQKTQWRLLWYGILIGILIFLSSLAIINRKALSAKFRRLASRHS